MELGEALVKYLQESGLEQSVMDVQIEEVQNAVGHIL